MKIYHAFPGGRAKALTMSYDDGKLADEKLLEIFNRYGIKGTFNLNYGLMDMDVRLKPEQIPRLYQGHEIATHTMTHPTIARCPLTQHNPYCRCRYGSALPRRAPAGLSALGGSPRQKLFPAPYARGPRPYTA